MCKIFPIVYQQSLYDCGLACIKSIAHYYNKGYPNSQSKDLNDVMVARHGISISDIRQELNTIGLESLPMECNIEDLMSHSLIPGIALLKSNHYVIVYDIDDVGVKVADPAIGCIQPSLEMFASDWYRDNQSNGIFIAIT